MTGEKKAVSPEHQTALFVCAQSGDVDIAQLLIDAGCDVNATDGDGCTALYVALDEDQADDLVGMQDRVAELLLSAGASPDIGNMDIGLGNTLLAWAASRRRLDHVQLLLRCGADPNKSGKSGMYPLHMAARCGAKDILQALIDGGADPSKTCTTHKTCPGVTARQMVERNPRSVANGCLEVLLTLPQ
eukprot:SAG25_NODE_593_length_6683_cov_31.125911_2_plen_188_part_00